MPIMKQKMILREDLKNNPRAVYVFGDNLGRSGSAGQAAEMRGEPNAIGVATKRYPSNLEAAFLSDRYYDDNVYAIQQDLIRIEVLLAQGVTVVFPADGIGTGLADLKRKAPKTFTFLENSLSELERSYTL